MLKKIISVFLALLLLGSLAFSVLAVDGTTGINSEHDYDSSVDLLAGSTFDVTRRFNDGRSDEVITSYPYSVWYDISSTYSVSFEWDFPYNSYENMFLFVKVPSNARVYLELDGSDVPLELCGNSGLLCCYRVSSSSFVSSAVVTFKCATADSLSSEPAILAFFGNVADTFEITEYYSKAWAHQVFYTEDVGGNIYPGLEVNVIEDETLHDSEDLSWRVSFQSSSTVDKVLMLTARVVIPCSSLISDYVECFNLDFMCMGEIYDVTASLTGLLDFDYSGFNVIESLNVSLSTNPNSSGTGSTGSDNYDYTAISGTISIDTAGLDLHNRYIVIDFNIDPVGTDYDRAYVSFQQLIPMHYRLDFSGSSNVYSSILSLLEKISVSSDSINDEFAECQQVLRDLFDLLLDRDYSSYLDSIIVILEENADDASTLLTEILTAIQQLASSEDLDAVNLSLRNLYTLLRSSDTSLKSIFTLLQSINNNSLGSIDQTLDLMLKAIQSINTWLKGYTDSSESDLNNSVVHAQDSAQELQDQLQVLETVPKTSVQQMNEVLQSVGNVVSEVSRDVNSNPGDNPNYLDEPAVFSTTLGYIFNGEDTVSGLIVQMMVLVASMCLIGYVLFGKR